MVTVRPPEHDCETRPWPTFKGGICFYSQIDAIYIVAIFYVGTLSLLGILLQMYLTVSVLPTFIFAINWACLLYGFLSRSGWLILCVSITTCLGAMSAVFEAGILSNANHMEDCEKMVAFSICLGLIWGMLADWFDPQN